MAQAGKLPDKEMRTPDSWANTSLCLVALAFLLALPGSALPQHSSTPGLDQLDRYKISINVSTVVLHATVKNRHGSKSRGSKLTIRASVLPQFVNTSSPQILPHCGTVHSMGALDDSALASSVSGTTHRTVPALQIPSAPLRQ